MLIHEDHASLEVETDSAALVEVISHEEQCH